MWIVLTLVEIILLLQSLDGLEPAASRENPLSRVHDVSLAFVLALESHLCHRTGIPFEALVSMLRVCIVLRFTAAATGLGFRSAPAHYIAEQFWY